MQNRLVLERFQDEGGSCRMDRLNSLDFVSDQPAERVGVRHPDPDNVAIFASNTV
jgi:hypothetical protein